MSPAKLSLMAIFCQPVRIQVEAHNSNTSTKVNRFVEILSADRPAAPAVTPPDSTTIRSDERAVFGIATEGAEKVAVRYLWVSPSYQTGYSQFTANGAVTTWNSYHYSEDAIIAYSFAVKVDGVWSQWSSYTEISFE